MDSGPRLLVKLKSMQDKESEKILEKILSDEETHVASGIKWYLNTYQNLCNGSGFKTFVRNIRKILVINLENLLVI